MPIAPPPDDLGLWPQVNALVEWPDTDEDRMRTLAASWGEAAGHADTLSQLDLGDLASWSDQAGGAFRGTMFELVAATRSVGTSMRELQTAATTFADTVTTAKQGIVDVIVRNLPAYGLTLQLDPAVAGAAQQRFVTEIAAWIRSLLDSLAARVPAPPPFEPPGLPKEPTTLDTIGDVAGIVSGIAGVAAFVPGLTAVAAPLALIAGGVALGAHSLDAVVNGPTSSTAATLTGDTLTLFSGARTAMLASSWADYIRSAEGPSDLMRLAAGTITDDPVRQTQGAVALSSALTVGGQAPNVATLVYPGDTDVQETGSDLTDGKLLLNYGKLLRDPGANLMRFLR